MTGSVDESVDEVDEPSQHAGPCKRKHSNRRKQLFRHVTAVDSGEENESQTNSQFSSLFSNDGKQLQLSTADFLMVSHTRFGISCKNAIL